MVAAAWEDQTDISRREKELIAATWKRQNDKAATAKDASEAGKFLSEVQTKLQDQALGAGRAHGQPGSLLGK